MPPLLRPFVLLLALVSAFAAAGLAPSPAGAAAIQIAADGNDPGIAVDAAGTAHIAFKSQTGAAFPYTYDYSYCRLPRGATACSPRLRLLTGGTPDGRLDHFGRAQVFVDATRVIVVGDTCCGSGEGVKAWVSTNGGTSFAAPKTLFGSIGINEAVLGPGAGSVSAIDSVTTGGVKYATGSLDGSTAAVTPFAIGAGIGPDSSGAYAYAGVGLLNASTPYTILSDGSRIWLRRFDSTKTGFNTGANWLAPQLIDGSSEANVNEPVTTYGPSGAFVAYSVQTPRPGLTYPYVVRRIGDDGSIGPPMELGALGASAIQGDIAQDAGGRVHVAYKDNHDENRLTYQWSKRGVTWADPVKLTVGDDDIRGMQIGVAPDGGGWIVAGSANHLTPIKVYPLEPKGDADPAPTPTTPATTPPPALACPAQIEVAKGIKAQVRTADCFKDLGKGKFTTSGSVRVNGVDFTAPASGKFTVDTKAHTIDAQGSYTTQVGSIVLRKGSLTWSVTTTNPVPGLSAFGVKLFGLGISGQADVAFDAKGAAVTVNVDLPYPLDGIRGQTTLRTTMSDGLIVEGVHITATTIPIGPVEVRNLDLLYTGANDGFEGHADIYLPPAAGKAISAGFGFAGGTFKHAEFEIGAPAPPFPLPLWAAPPVVLNRIGLAAINDDAGFTLKGGVELLAGKEIAGLKPVSINALPPAGGASLFIPKSGAYAVISAKGKIAILDIPVATGQFSISTQGPVTFGGSANIDFEILDINVLIEGGINLSNAEFYAGGKGSACVSLLDLEGCAKVSAILSSIGFAVCGSLEGKEKLTGLSASIGLGYDRKWGGSGHLGDCKYDEYKPASLSGSGARARRLAADGTAALLRDGPVQTVVLPKGTQRGVRIKGAGGRPGFVFAGPGGRTITVPAGTSEPVLASKVAAVPVGADEIELQVTDPAGSWTLTPAAGSTIASVNTAQALPTPKLSGSVKKTGGRGRQITVKASNLGEQRLIVRELLPGGGAHELGTVKKNGATTLRFTPTDGPAGKRAIEAVIVAGDRQVGTAPITTYTAPGPEKLAAPRSVTLKRSKNSVSVKWKKVAGADRYRVKITATDGRQQILTVGKSQTKVTVPAVTTDDKVTVKVSGVTKLGAEGQSRAATSKATRKKAKNKK